MIGRQMLLTLLQTLRQFQVEFKVLVRGPDMSIRHGVKRSDWLVRGAAGSIKPGVERSETPGSKSPKAIEPAKRSTAIAITKPQS